jgi:hypothetical protein
MALVHNRSSTRRVVMEEGDYLFKMLILRCVESVKLEQAPDNGLVFGVKTTKAADAVPAPPKKKKAKVSAAAAAEQPQEQTQTMD